jgi:hypothetical protein
MSAEIQLVAVLRDDPDVSALVDMRIYPDILPQNPVYPSITYFEIDPGAQYCLSGPSDLTNPQIQVDCWAVTRSGAKDLAAKVKAAIDGANTFKGLLVAGRSIYEDEVDVYRSSLDFSIWYKELES